MINTCKEMMAYSDFPIPREYPPFPHNTQIVEYFKMYAERFGLRDRIRFNTTVDAVRPADDYAATGRYHVTFHGADGAPKVDVFDAVLVCSGHHWKPRVPTFPGQDKFKGRVMHSHAYKEPAPFTDRNVVVVGIGNSGTR